MAKINNQEVMQKLIDELQLYPGKDVIPTELAEKILPVFQVNSEEITVSPTPANIVRTNATPAHGDTQTIYSVPATGKFYLTNVALAQEILSSAAADTHYKVYIEVTIDGTAQKILVLGGNHNLNTFTGSDSAISLNLQNPILIDAGTDIEVTSEATAYAHGTIIGYTE